VKTLSTRKRGILNWLSSPPSAHRRQTRLLRRASTVTTRHHHRCRHVRKCERVKSYCARYQTNLKLPTRHMSQQLQSTSTHDHKRHWNTSIRSRSTHTVRFVNINARTSQLMMSWMLSWCRNCMARERLV
jgi:hypothetical protein